MARIASRSIQTNPEVVARVAAIIDAVRTEGDDALIRYTKQFDGVDLSRAEIRIDPALIRETAARANARTVEAFRGAIENVRAFHELQRENTWEIRTDNNVVLGQRILPVDSAGLYVPGGTAAYPSSVIMNVIPARVAGVPRILITTPPGTLERVPEIAAVLCELGIEEVYRIGGAQAIAALAYGTETIPRVAKIAGPGNVYVALAKKLVYGSVGIDSIAGPTEIVILADESADPEYIAADMLAQAEHDEAASAILITSVEALAREVVEQIERQLDSLERRDIARASIKQYGAIIVVESVEQGCELVNKLAPEHLELMTTENDSAAAAIENAGAIFFGPWSSEPVGDYFAGPNHVLPTLGTSRFSSPLGVYDFVKRQSIIRYTREALAANRGHIAAMAEAEGLTGHARAILLRKTQAE
ncbi:MAG: histidinol dehydrogenase [Blastocatellia bacterium AA13]|nr:MAG: histidinol dehydrogenase [Blastocatellia bacterium AA13]